MKINQKISISIFLIIFLLVLVSGDIFTIGTLGVFAQNTDSTPKTVPRTVLVELFVQEGCLTCPTAEFCLEDLAWEYDTTQLILVEEHLWVTVTIPRRPMPAITGMLVMVKRAPPTYLSMA
ncbi:hypothetical protein KKB07_06300 [bacterium]|nr:hypothetical protein [bacterium]